MANTDGILFGVLPVGATGEAQINLGRCMTLPRYATGSDPYAGYIKITPVAESTAMEVYTNSVACFGVVDFSQLDVADKAALSDLYLGSSSLAGVPILTGLTALVTLGANNNTFITPPTLTGLTALTSVDFSSTGLTSAPTLTGLTGLTNLNLSNNALPTAEVNAVLAALDDLGASNGFVNLSGGTNGAPSGAGLTAKTSLEGKGWTVTVN